MPEPYWPKRKQRYLLSDAMQNARFAVIWCGYCKRRRYFMLEELKRIFGDIECDDVVDRQPWHCTGCNGKGGSLHMRLEDPPAAGGVIVQRLEKIFYIRRIRWRDERR